MTQLQARTPARLFAALLALATAMTTLGAQEPILVETVWSQTRSLELFAACDRDGNDRLDVFEIRAALVELGNSRDPSVLRRLDTDSSGFLEWPEFDARFRLAIDKAKSFRVRPALPPPPIEDPTATPAVPDATELVIGVTDDNGDGLLSRPELAAFLRRLRQDPALIEHFPTLDRDGSGTLDVEEFRPVVMMVPNVLVLLGANEQLRRGLPADDREADRNLDGSIDRAELRAALIRLHPSLERWTDRVMLAADRSRNGTLGGAELAAARTTARRAQRED